MNIIQYLYYYNGGGVAAGDIDNDGLTDLFFTSNLEKNRLFKNLGAMKFEEITEKSGVAGAGKWKTGCSMADVNGDGFLDIYVCQVGNYKKFQGKNQLFINQKNGQFLEQAASYGLDFQGFSTQAAFLDFDLDGDLDCFLLNHSVHSPESYQPAESTRKFDAMASDRLFRNDGERKNADGKPLPIFTDITGKSGLHDGKSGYGLGVAVGDVNLDGWPDIFVANDFHENDFLYLNRGGKFFEETSARSFGHNSNFSMGCDLADFNNDGWPDILSLDMKPEFEEILKKSAPADAFQIYNFKHDYGYHWQFPRNNLQLNLRDSSAIFSEIGQLAGVATTDWSWSGLFADFDLDGWKDIFITNGIPHRPNDLEYNRFIASAEIQAKSSDLDLIKKMPSGRAKNYAFRNSNNLIFENVAEKWGLDPEGFSNGAAFADLDNDGDLDLVTNNLNETAGIFQNNSTGKNWLKIKLEGEGKNPFAIGAKIFVKTKNTTQCFENQPVRGFQSSSELNFTVGLGDEKTAEILVRWPDGTVCKTTGEAGKTIFLKKKNCSAAAGFPISTAQNVLPKFEIIYPKNDSAKTKTNDFENEKLLPWAYSDPFFKISDADKKQFSRLILEKKEWFEQAACLRSADFDGDGDLDIFAGNHCFSGFYGISPSSFLLKNDGSGNFSDASDLLAGGSKIGMISDAAWSDFDGDGDLDLAVVGEWMPLTIFKNEGQNFSKIEVKNSSGLWNCLATADFDGDGKTDLLAGNFGLNSNLAATPAEPLGLWVRDFDGNGSFDPILTYFRQGKNRVFADKDLIVSQLPMLKKRFVKYEEFARSTFEDVFPKDFRKGAIEKRAEILASCFFKNEGGGQFSISLLPIETQFSSVFSILPADFDGDGKTEILLAGNNFEISPSVGRQDAGFGVLLAFENGKFVVRQSPVFKNRVAVRGLKKLENGKILILE